MTTVVIKCSILHRGSLVLVPTCSPSWVALFGKAGDGRGTVHQYHLSPSLSCQHDSWGGVGSSWLAECFTSNESVHNDSIINKALEERGYRLHSKSELWTYQSHLSSNISLCVHGWPGLRKWKTSAEGGTWWHHVFQKDLKGATSRSQRFPDALEANIYNYYLKQLDLKSYCWMPTSLSTGQGLPVTGVKLLSNIVLICLDLGLELLQSFLMCFASFIQLIQWNLTVTRILC